MNINDSSATNTRRAFVADTDGNVIILFSCLLRTQDPCGPSRPVFFYPRDAMLARVLATALCLSVCLSVTNLSFIETNRRIELVFAWELYSTCPTLCYKKILVSPKITELSSFPPELRPKLRT